MIFLHWLYLYVTNKRHFVKKKKKGTREQGNSGLVEEGAPLRLLAGETFLEAVLAPLNTMEMSWGRRADCGRGWDAGSWLWPFPGLHLHQSWGLQPQVDSNPSTHTAHLCASLCGGVLRTVGCLVVS